ncbi:hypothetical protein EVAR_28555_1 [Eumeta japonica]|uniref:Uncharacterized protein n=1 Tax=Eumeta variegata TaxID=151549 RepID=A0A4C1UWU8_EUMVA|nr:hypothetical protein EVAR_28555_1 [Eumeta japonica]
MITKLTDDTSTVSLRITPVDSPGRPLAPQAGKSCANLENFYNEIWPKIHFVKFVIKSNKYPESLVRKEAEPERSQEPRRCSAPRFAAT